MVGAMQQHTPLLIEIDAFLARTGMAPSYFGKISVGNSELVDRLRAGGDVRTRTAERVRAFIESRSLSSDPASGAS